MGAAADAVRAGVALPLQHAEHARAAAGADRQSRASTRSRPRPVPPARATSTSWSSRAVTAHTPSRGPTPSTSATWSATTAPARPSAAARPTDAGAGVLGWPVGHSRSPAMLGAAFRELGLDWRYLPLPVPPELFEETVRALPGVGLRGRERDGAPQARGPRPLRRAERYRPRDRRREHPELPPTGAIEGENTDAPGLLDAIGETVRRAGARWCWAPAARAGRRSGRCARPAPRCRSGTAPRSARRTLADELGVRHARSDRSPPTCWSTRPASGWNPARRRTRGAGRARAGAGRSPRRSSWTWSTARSRRPSCAGPSRRRLADDRRSRGAGAPGRAEPRAVDRRRPSAGGHERSRPSRVNLPGPPADIRRDAPSPPTPPRPSGSRADRWRVLRLTRSERHLDDSSSSEVTPAPEADTGTPVTPEQPKAKTTTDIRQALRGSEAVTSGTFSFSFGAAEPRAHSRREVPEPRPGRGAAVRYRSSGAPRRPHDRRGRGVRRQARVPRERRLAPPWWRPGPGTRSSVHAPKARTAGRARTTSTTTRRRSSTRSSSAAQETLEGAPVLHFAGQVDPKRSQESFGEIADGFAKTRLEHAPAGRPGSHGQGRHDQRVGRG